jgi:hypothetical protein
LGQQFKSKLVEAWQRLGKLCAAQAAFRELGEDMLRASPTHRERVRMVFSICEAAVAVTNLSNASQGFWQAGLAPWGPARPLESPYIKEGEIPGELPVSPFEAEEGGPLVALTGELFDWMLPQHRPSPELLDRCFAARPSARKRVALPDAAPMRAPIVLTDGDLSESDGEDFNVPDEASEAEVDLLDVGALDGESL